MSTTILTHGVRLARKRTLTFSQLRIFGFFLDQEPINIATHLVVAAVFSRFSCWGVALQNKKA